MNVLKATHSIGVKKIVACLSTCIFPDKTTYPINESMLHSGPPHVSNDAYAKRLLETHCWAYQEQYGDNFVCVIPTNIYGPYDNFHLENAHVIPALIHECYLAKKYSKPFIVAGFGIPLRQFIYSPDLDKSPIILYVGEKQEVSIGYITSLISKKFNYLDSMVYDNSKPDGQYKKTASNAKLMELIGNFKFVDIEEGINTTINRFEANYDKIRK